MYGLNAVAFVFFVVLNMLAYQLCMCSDTARNKVITALCLLLLLGNLIRYLLVYPFFEGVIKIPVEFSAVSYFAVPVILLTARKGMRSGAAYSGLMAGFFYYMAMAAAGGPLYAAYQPYDIYISLLCHGTLYICGLVTLGTEAFILREAPKLALCVALVGGKSNSAAAAGEWQRRAAYIYFAGRSLCQAAAAAKQLEHSAAGLLYRSGSVCSFYYQGFFYEKSKAIP